MNSTTRNRLLACTALIGVSAIASQAYAADVTIDDTTDTPAGVVAVTLTAADDDFVVQGVNAATVDHGTGTITLSGGTNDITVIHADANDAFNVTLTVTGDVNNTTGSLLVKNDEATNAKISAVLMTVSGTTSIFTTTNITTSGAGDAVHSATLTLNGNATLTGLVALDTTTAGNAGSDAVLNLNGASVTATAGITLNDDVAQSIVNFTPLAAQLFTGTIDGAAAGEGTVNVLGGANLTTFASAIGATNKLAALNVGSATLLGAAQFNSTVAATDIIVASDAAGAVNTSATFKGGVTGTVKLGDDGDDLNITTVTFDGTTAGFTVTGTVNGVGATDINNVNVIGGKTITTAGAWGANLDNVTVSGAGTVLTGAANDFDALTKITLAGGTLKIGAAATLVAAIDGAGTLQISNDTTVSTGTIGGTTPLTSVLVDTTKTLTVNSAVYKATTTTLTGTGILAFNAAAHTITGNIVGAADGDGTLALTDGAFTTAIVGNLGTSATARLGSLTINDTADATLITTTGNLFVKNTIVLGENDTLQLIGVTPQTVSAAISGSAAGKGLLVVGNGVSATNATFNGVIGATSLASGTVNLAAAATLNANSTFAGEFKNLGTTTLGVGTTLTAGTIGVASTGTFIVNLSDVDGTLASTDIGQLASGGAINLSAAKVNVIYNVAEGTVGVGSVLFANGVGLAVLPTAVNVTDNTLAYTTTLVAGPDTSDINLVVAFAGGGFASITSSPNTDAVATAFQTLATAPFPAQTPAVTALVNAFIFAPTAAAADAIAQQVIPTVDGGAIQSAMTFTSRTQGVVASELASLRHQGDAVSGISAGDNGQGARFWLQAFGSAGEQDPRDGINGYEADSYGFSAGVDTRSFGPNSVFGIAISYNNADIDSFNLNTTNTEIDSYQGTVYGSMGLGNMNYVSGMVGYVWSDNDTSRNISIIPALPALPIVGVANGSYDSDQFVANLEVGHDVKSGIMTFTPNVFANYGNYSADNYTETSATGLGISVATEDMDLFELGIGADVMWDIKQSGDGVLRPSLSASYRYDFIADEMNSTSSFTGAPGVSFKTTGAEPEENKFTLGGGLKYFDNQWELSANYGFDYMEDYDAHSGMVRAGFNF